MLIHLSRLHYIQAGRLNATDYKYNQDLAFGVGLFQFLKYFTGSHNEIYKISKSEK